MVTKLMNKFLRNFNFLLYRFRYLINYILIGLGSVILEIIIVSVLSKYAISSILSLPAGFLFGMMLSFILNSKLNFRVPKNQNTRTFFLFIIISTIAFLLNLFLMGVLSVGFSSGYGKLRLVTSACIFMASYMAHRKITFDFIKEIGVAVYLTEDESIKKIYSKIKYYSDFVHVDLVDNSIADHNVKLDLSLFSELEKTWGLKKIVHIMSKKPTKWIEKIHPYVDSIIFHRNIDEEVFEVIEKCINLGKKIGMAVSPNEKVQDILPYLRYLDFVQIMGIDELGKSGQNFDPLSLDNLKEANKLKRDYSFEIIFDGGVKPTNIARIDAKYIVAASSLLRAPEPIKSFMELKTSSRYRDIREELRNEIISKTKKIFEETKFIKSGTFVGTFAEKNSLEGISDIDIVIILDNLERRKFKEIVKKFERVGLEIESNYGYNVILNCSLGPLKYNKDNIVFHLMIYDEKLHYLHCKNSPFTCYDWQRSSLYTGKKMSEIYGIRVLQPNYFFNSRRGSEEYLSEIKKNVLSYRAYDFNKDRVIQKKEFKRLTHRGQIEFGYHILRFIMTNFLKLYYKENKKYSLNQMLGAYFSLFSKNKSKHNKFIKRIYRIKNKSINARYPHLITNLIDFIKDFEEQFKKYFYEDSKEITFIRHGKTKLNKKGYFLGRNLDPEPIKINRETLFKLSREIENVGLLISSPMKRCTRTMTQISKKELLVEPRLIEINYGELDGKNIGHLSKNYPEIIKEWKRGMDPRFPGGENSLDVWIRLSKFLDEIRERDCKKVWICTHNTLLRALIGRYFNLPINEWHKINIPHLMPIKFIQAPNEKLYIDLKPEQYEEVFKNFPNG